MIPRAEIEVLIEYHEALTKPFASDGKVELAVIEVHRWAAEQLRMLLKRFPEPEPGWRPAFLSLSFEPGGGGHYYGKYDRAAVDRLADERDALVARVAELEAQLAAAEERQARAKHWLGELKHLGEIQMKAEASFIPSVFGESWYKGWKNGHEAAGMACQALAGHGLAEVEALDAGREGE